MRIFGQEFCDTTIDWIREAIRTEPTISRRALSRRLCNQLDWRSPNGRLREVNCRKALLELHRRGHVCLPDRSGEWSFQRRGSPSRQVALPAPHEVDCALEELGSVEIYPVKSRYSKASRIWNALMDAHHYLGCGPLCGAQMRYLIRSERFGWLGGLAFSAAAWRVKGRDTYIGWSESARLQNLQLVVNNSRFLILPTVNVPNLASHILSLCSKRVLVDWEERYSYRPALLETFVERGRFKGTCYRAANWQHVGITTGRGRQNDGRPCKDVYIYPLCGNWKGQLCTEPDGSISFPVPEPLREPSDWAEEELGSCDLGDERLTARLLQVASGFYGQPGANVPQAMGSRAATKGAYRLFDNRRVDMDTVLESHYQATEMRIREHETVLAVQDTTSLNYTAHPATQGLGPINTEQDNGTGLMLHDTMIFTTQGTPLGLADVQCWARDEEETGKRHQRYKKPIEQKESFKWLKSYRTLCEVQQRCPNTTVISVSDRESDIYELFVEAHQRPNGPKVLVRAERSRNRKLDQGKRNVPPGLWQRMRQEQVKGTLQVAVPQGKDHLPRKAKLEIRFAQVELQPPKRKKKLSPVSVWAVYAVEAGCPANAEPLEWMLLTTAEVTSFEQAVQTVQWYVRRWGIEVYHRVLKSGCRIEDRQLRTVERIENCLAIDMVVAWRIHHLTFLGRETPDLPCTVFFEDLQWKALVSFINKNPSLPETPPTLRQATRLVASLGGFLGRNSDGEPGTETIWRGLQRLDNITQCYKAFGPPAHTPSTPARDPPRCG